MRKIKLGVIFGGMSTEHDVSVVSATSIIKNLDKEKYEIHPIYIGKKGEWYRYTKPVEEIQIANLGEPITELEKIENEFGELRKLDVAFPVLHGLYGEDGTIQGLLELLKVKYVGCGVLSSSICMDKAYSKMIFEKAQIPQAKYIRLKVENKKGLDQKIPSNETQNTKETKQEYSWIDDELNEQNISLKEITTKVKQELGFPVFIKPSNSGSSVGITKVQQEQDLKQAIEHASQFDTKILIEEAILGREVECAVLGNRKVEATCVGEILPAEEFYTFDAKYKNADSRVMIPAKIAPKKQEEIQKLAIKAFQAVDGKGLARVDFFIKENTEEVIINEINTLPGFTQISMYPKLWEAYGINYTKLLDQLIELVFIRKSKGVIDKKKKERYHIQKRKLT